MYVHINLWNAIRSYERWSFLFFLQFDVQFIQTSQFSTEFKILPINGRIRDFLNNSISLFLWRILSIAHFCVHYKFIASGSWVKHETMLCLPLSGRSWPGAPGSWPSLRWAPCWTCPSARSRASTALYAWILYIWQIYFFNVYEDFILFSSIFHPQSCIAIRIISQLFRETLGFSMVFSWTSDICVHCTWIFSSSKKKA